MPLSVELENGKGITRDVSPAGVFFLTDLSFSINAPINLWLVLERVDPVGPLRVRCHGRVVRLEGSDGVRGVAVAITSHDLERSRLLKKADCRRPTALRAYLQYVARQAGRLHLDLFEQPGESRLLKKV